ncbi:sigma-70 region 4 domain-containing protein [Arsukibacterium sp.]|uniref:sigma-70 region 4 domain-containing protein n=1 Tax=Arsukibacterium sp. TaxID=1977258 RepID=UPI00299D6BCF|nr:sigma-70 region 4 domain-containing protein [Arsukibacterium sp.]MDX1678474.1 sigma-70 region 4 domain-containing protein [Arsukibacterium sp.]
MSATYAVLTGDFVKSRSIAAGQYDIVLYQLEQLLVTQARALGCSYSFYRGDAFQILLPQPAEAVTLALYIRLTLLSLSRDCKISIGLGEVTNLRRDVKSASGPAFTLSGNGLDNLHSGQRFAIHSQQSSVEQVLAVPLQMADRMLSKLTARQSEALLLYFLTPGSSHENIADKLGTSRENVTKLLNNNHADYQLLQAFIQYCHSHITRSLG